MAVTILDAIVHTTTGYATSFAVSAGSNRWAGVFALNNHGTDAAPPTTITLGGEAPTQTTTVHVAAADVTATLALWDEASVAAMSGNTLTITGDTAGNRASVHFSVQDASQALPSPASDGVTGTSGAISLARVADGFTVAASVHDVANNFSSFTNPSLTAQAQTGTMVTGYGSEASVDETVNFTWANVFNRDNASIVVNFAPAGAAAASLPLQSYRYEQDNHSFFFRDQSWQYRQQNADYSAIFGPTPAPSTQSLLPATRLTCGEVFFGFFIPAWNIYHLEAFSPMMMLPGAVAAAVAAPGTRRRRRVAAFRSSKRRLQ